MLIQNCVSFQVHAPMRKLELGEDNPFEKFPGLTIKQVLFPPT